MSHSTCISQNHLLSAHNHTECPTSLDLSSFCANPLCNSKPVASPLDPGPTALFPVANHCLGPGSHPDPCSIRAHWSFFLWQPFTHKSKSASRRFASICHNICPPPHPVLSLTHPCSCLASTAMSGLHMFKHSHVPGLRGHERPKHVQMFTHPHSCLAFAAMSGLLQTKTHFQTFQLPVTRVFKTNFMPKNAHNMHL